MRGDVEVRPLAAQDAPGLAACVNRAYGDTYPKRVLYDPQEASALIRAGDYGGVVAVAGGEIVGHIGFSRPSPDATVVEAGTTIVDVRHRGRGLMGRMAERLGAALLDEAAAGFIHFPTTAHTVMQRASVVSGHETGILLAYIPRDTVDGALGKDAAGRLAVTVVYQPLGAAPPQAIFVPARYGDRVRTLADRLGLEREICVPRQQLTGATELQHSVIEARSLTAISIARAGEDLPRELDGRLARTATQLVHVDLAMNDPGIGPAAEILWRRGFAYAAWLPGWNGHDVLRMQRVLEPTGDELTPNLYTREAQALCLSIADELRV